MAENYMTDIEKAKKNFQESSTPSTPSTTAPSSSQNKKNVAMRKYNLNEENQKRERGRRLLHITSILKEIGFPVKMGYSLDTLRGMGDDSKIIIPDGIGEDVGIIELLKMTDEHTLQVKDFLIERGIVVFHTTDYTYDNDAIVTRLVIQPSSIKEV